MFLFLVLREGVFSFIFFSFVSELEEYLGEDEQDPKHNTNKRKNIILGKENFLIKLYLN
tara:strand:- start:656 stop:832 length:177 start_codon:yes stop_codon:yes gene_type:complete